MLRFEDYKLRTEQAFALLHSTSPYDMYARVEIMCTLKILKYQLGEFQCHVRRTDEQIQLRAEILEFYPSYAISPSEDMIRHNLCSCENIALKPDPEAVERKVKQQIIKLANAKPLDLEPIAKLINEEITSITTPVEDREHCIDKSVKSSATLVAGCGSIIKEPKVVAVIEDQATGMSVKTEINDGDFREECLIKGYVEEPNEKEDIPSVPTEEGTFKSKDSASYDIELDSQRDIIERTKLVAHYFKYERGAGKTKIRYDMYRLNNIIIRYDNRGSEMHIVRRQKEFSDNILYEISDPNRTIGPDVFDTWLGHPSEQESYDHAAIITKIRHDISSKRNQNLFNHRLKFLGMKLF